MEAFIERVGEHMAFVALGSNLERPAARLERAFSELAALAHTRLQARSGLYRTAPIGKPDQPDFINAVAQLATRLAPLELLDELLRIEQGHGRQRSARNDPRTLDLDLLLYDDLFMHEARLQLPHPRMHERAFVLVPLNEIAPGARIPGVGVVADLLPTVSGQRVEPFRAA